MVESLRQFRAHVLGRHFTVRSDHSALLYLCRVPNLIGQQAWWLNLLGEFDFSIEHCAGVQHGNADALSRCSYRSCVFCTAPEKLDFLAVGSEPGLQHESPWDVVELMEALRKDHDLQPIIEWREASKTAPNWTEVLRLGAETKELWEQWDLLTLVQGVLYRKWITGVGSIRWLQLEAPKSLRRER